MSMVAVKTSQTVDYGIDVRSIRERLNLSQVRFANKYGFNLSTLRDWEQGRHPPIGAARILISVIANHPEIVDKVLDQTRAVG